MSLSSSSDISLSDTITDSNLSDTITSLFETSIDNSPVSISESEYSSDSFTASSIFAPVSSTDSQRSIKKRETDDSDSLTSLSTSSSPVFNMVSVPYLHTNIINIQNVFKHYNNSMAQLVNILKLIRNYMDTKMANVLYEDQSTGKIISRRILYPIIPPYTPLVPVKGVYLYPISDKTVAFVQNMKNAIDANHTMIKNMVDMIADMEIYYNNKIEEYSKQMEGI